MGGFVPDKLTRKIDKNEYTIYDKIVYGGLGYGTICLPTHLPKIILSIIFPPLGIIIKHLNILPYFPYVTFDTFKSLLLNLHEIMISIVLTSLFYVPGLVYSLRSLKCVTCRKGKCDK